MTTAGTTFLLNGPAPAPGSRHKITLNLLGKYNIYNALAAAAAAHSLGISAQQFIKGLESLSCVPGRLEQVAAGQDFTVFVDYAHTDSALEQVLQNIKELPHEKIITVFGCGGDRDRTKRAPMGICAARHSAAAVITNDNPRSEDPLQIFSDIEKGLLDEGFSNYSIIPDRQEAIFAAIKKARKGDIVLIAGKGHEDYQIFKDKTTHFDDKETALEAIKEK